MMSAADSEIPPLSDEQLAQLADESFVVLDRREAAGAVGINTAAATSARSGREMLGLLHVCPKCGGRMEQGFVVDMATGDFSFGVDKWARGLPLRSLLFKTWVLRNAPPVGTFRCESCGYLESYAREEFAAKGMTQFSLRTLLILVTVVSVVLGLVAWAARW